MKVGFCGLGKLGFPCAVSIQMKGHDVMGYDIVPEVMNNEPKKYLEAGPENEGHFNTWLEQYPIKFGSLEEVAAHSEIIFLSVQTPHDPEHEGITRISAERKDFDYSYLESAVEALADVIQRDTVVVIISTVLPGTIRERVIPLANQHMKLCYNPFFIAMGTTMHDFLNPEFILFGVHDDQAAMTAKKFYETLVDAPFYNTTVENAELIKVAYNTFIGVKIVYANALMEMCHKLPGCDVDGVTNGLKLATTRLISGKYLSGGMGDGGGCHPRDNIALSWLAERLNLSSDIFEDLMVAREWQTDWLADLIEEHRKEGMPVVICGEAFKENTNLTVGSPARLLINILKERGIMPVVYDPIVNGTTALPAGPCLYFIATKHDIFQGLDFVNSPGSVVLDPWRYLDAAVDVTYIPIGK